LNLDYCISFYVNVNYLPFRPESSNEFAKEIFARADKNGSKTIDKNELKQIFKDLQIYVKNKRINEIMDKYDYNKNGKIDFDEFKALVKELLKKEELVPIFKRYCPSWNDNNLNEPVMSLEMFQKFFEEEQHQSINIDQIRAFHYSLEEISPILPAISFDLFCDFLFSMMNTIFKVRHSYNYQVNLFYF